MQLIRIMRFFIQIDTNESLQRKILVSKDTDPAVTEQYQRIVSIADQIKFKKPLTFSDQITGARYYRTLKNELSGRTLRYESTKKE